MIPAAFSYQRPATLDDALAALAASNGSAKVLAGGMSLLPLMKLRLASADTLIDIGRLPELKGARATADGGFELGALTTYAEVLAATQLDFARDCILGIGDVQVRNRGTVGGAHRARRPRLGPARAGARARLRDRAALAARRASRAGRRLLPGGLRHRHRSGRDPRLAAAWAAPGRGEGRLPEDGAPGLRATRSSASAP